MPIRLRDVVDAELALVVGAQQYARAPVEMPHVKPSPALIAENAMPPVTSVGLSRVVVVLLPICPASLYPQHHARFVVSIAQL